MHLSGCTFFSGGDKLRAHLERLAALQVVDLKIQEMEREKGEIPQRMTTLEEDFKAEEVRVHAQRLEMEKLQKERRQKEKDLEEEIDRVKKAETRVFEIKTNKEYQAVLKEIENAKKLNRQREEEILGILERIEEAQRNLSKGEKNLQVKRSDFQSQINELQQKAASFEQEMAGEVLERQEIEKKIPSDLLNRYRRLLEKRQGIAIAKVQNGVCQACHMNLRPQLHIELQKEDALILCPNCSRILFWANGLDKGKGT